jgi:cobalt-precorrin 5A hydrolase
VIAIGIGANSQASQDDVLAAIDGIRREADGADIVATFDGAAFAHLVQAAAPHRSLEYQALPLEALRQRNADCMTHSDRTLDLFGIASIAETSALAAAGPASQLILARRIIGNTTVAAAKSADAKEVLP